VAIKVPAGTVAVDKSPRRYTFRVGAYAETDQQEDFTLSQEYSFSATAQGKRGGIPWWVLAAAAGVLVVILGVTAAVLLGGDDEFEVADYIGGTVAQAEGSFEGTVAVFAAPGASGAPDDCVLFQAPRAEAAAAEVALYAVECPTPSPTPVLPSPGDLCTDTPGFCDAVDQSFSSTQWAAAQTLMLDDFRMAFTIDGVETPNIVGLPLIEARAALQAADLEWAEVDDGSGGEPCRNDEDQNQGRPVLLQHPYASTMTATETVVTLVLTACPEQVSRPEQVQIDSLIDTDGFSNLAAAVPGYARALRDDPLLGPDYLGSEAMAERLADMVGLFRYSFAIAQVPDGVGNRLGSATTLMENAGLTVNTQLRTSNPPENCSIISFCFGYVQVSTVVEQSLEPGVRIADLPADQAITLTYDTDWVFELQYVEATIIDPEVRAALEVAVDTDG
jgi:beta-lactam-binding protein with PASTA domain